MNLVEKYYRFEKKHHHHREFTVSIDFDGTIAEIMVANGTGVEFDQPIMRVE